MHENFFNTKKIFKGMDRTNKSFSISRIKMKPIFILSRKYNLDISLGRHELKIFFFFKIIPSKQSEFQLITIKFSKS